MIAALLKNSLRKKISASILKQETKKSVTCYYEKGSLKKNVLVNLFCCSNLKKNMKSSHVFFFFFFHYFQLVAQNEILAIQVRILVKFITFTYLQIRLGKV